MEISPWQTFSSYVFSFSTTIACSPSLNLSVRILGGILHPPHLDGASAEGFGAVPYLLVPRDAGPAVLKNLGGNSIFITSALSFYHTKIMIVFSITNKDRNFLKIIAQILDNRYTDVVSLQCKVHESQTPKLLIFNP